jgi:hypothetical protein
MGERHAKTVPLKDRIVGVMPIHVLSCLLPRLCLQACGRLEYKIGFKPPPPRFFISNQHIKRAKELGGAYLQIVGDNKTRRC